MTYQQDHIVPILWAGQFALGNTGASGPGTYPRYLQLMLPTDVKLGDKIHLYYTGKSAGADDQTPGIHFAKMNIGATTTAIDGNHDVEFDTNQQITGDVALDIGNAYFHTGKATLTLIAELVTYIQGGNTIGFTHYNSTSTNWLYIYDWTIVLERV